MTLRETLRLRYTIDSTQLGDDVSRGCKHETPKAYWISHIQWWSENAATLPACRAPVPILIDEHGIVVALLRPEALVSPPSLHHLHVVEKTGCV